LVGLSYLHTHVDLLKLTVVNSLRCVSDERVLTHIICILFNHIINKSVTLAHVPSCYHTTVTRKGIALSCVEINTNPEAPG